MAKRIERTKILCGSTPNGRAKCSAQELDQASDADLKKRGSMAVTHSSAKADTGMLLGQGTSLPHHSCDEVDEERPDCRSL